MAKKSFREEENNSIQETTKKFFSNETLQAKGEEVKPVEEVRTKRAYVKRVIKDNKSQTITLRLTEGEFNKLQDLVNASEYDNISSYIRNLLKKEGL